jgi:hypothetical protein
MIAKRKMLCHNGVFVAEHATREVIMGYSDEWQLLTQRIIGDTVIDLFRFHSTLD